MSSSFALVRILIAGFATGALFFGGLWYTVQKGVTARIPALWFFASFIFRVVVTLAASYYVSGSAWQRLLLFFGGFFIGRIVITKLTNGKQLKLIREELK